MRDPLPTILRVSNGLGLVFLFAGGLIAADWPQWRGPQRDGTIADWAAPETWPKQFKQQWTVEVGEGHASPVVAGEQVFVVSREEDKEVVRAVKLADGRVQWSHSYPAPYTPSSYASSHGKGPKSTPLIAGDRLITIGITSIVSCWEIESGKMLWQQDFSTKFKQPSSLFYGMAASPLISGKHVIAYLGVSDDGALMALDLETGKVQWKWNGDGPGYASPILATLGNSAQLITQSQGACIGVDPAQGSLLWSIPYKTEYDQNIVTPVMVDDLVVFSGLSKGTIAYRLEKVGDKWTPKQVWHNADVSMYMSSPVVVGKNIYGLANRSKGQFFCLDGATGKTLWTSDGRMGENAAILAAGKTLLALTTQSELIAWKATPERFELVARTKVAETPTWAHPTIVGNKLLVKDRSSLTLWTIGE